MANDKYDLDGVSSVDCSRKEAPIPYGTGKGDTSLDDVESTSTDASLRFTPDKSQRPGPAVDLDAVTSVDGMATQTDYSGGTGTVESWPRGWE